jgi:hypothetical protein
MEFSLTELIEKYSNRHGELVRDKTEKNSVADEQYLAEARKAMDRLDEELTAARSKKAAETAEALAARDAARAEADAEYSRQVDNLIREITGENPDEWSALALWMVTKGYWRRFREQSTIFLGARPKSLAEMNALRDQHTWCSDYDQFITAAMKEKVLPGVTEVECADYMLEKVIGGLDIRSSQRELLRGVLKAALEARDSSASTEKTDSDATETPAEK